MKKNNLIFEFYLIMSIINICCICISVITKDILMTLFSIIVEYFFIKMAIRKYE